MVSKFIENIQSCKRRHRVSCREKELFLDFIANNPEMITHTSTYENEKNLWKKLASKLNASGLRIRDAARWKQYWERWTNGVLDKEEGELTLLDYRLKKFLYNIGPQTEEMALRMKDTNNLSLKEIDSIVEDIEVERSKNLLLIDDMNYRIICHQKSIEKLKNSIKSKKQKNRKLISQKKFYMSKIKKLMIPIKLENDDCSD